VWAAAEGHVEVVEALLKAGADLHARAKAPPPPPIDPGRRPRRRQSAAPTIRPPQKRKRGRRINRPQSAAPPTDFYPLPLCRRNGHFPVGESPAGRGGRSQRNTLGRTSALVLAAMNARNRVGRGSAGIMTAPPERRRLRFHGASSGGLDAPPEYFISFRRRYRRAMSDSIGFAKALIAHGKSTPRIQGTRRRATSAN